VSAALAACDSQAAVIGFLILSGYSIAASIEREPVGYIGRRALRILPLYWLAIAATAACMIGVDAVITKEWCYIPAPHPLRLMGSMAFLQGFACTSVGANGVVWSLSIEVLFYALAPWLRGKSTGYVMLLASLSGAFFLLLGLRGTSPMPILGGQAAWIGWAWLLGFGLYRLPAALAGLLSVVVPAILSMAIGRWDHPAWSLPLIAVGLVIGFGDLLPASLRRVGDCLGGASYPLYLIHMPVFIVLTRLAQQVWQKMSIPGAGLIASAVAVALILDWAYDRPIKRVVRWVIVSITSRRCAVSAGAQGLAQMVR